MTAHRVLTLPIFDGRFALHGRRRLPACARDAQPPRLAWAGWCVFRAQPDPSTGGGGVRLNIPREAAFMKIRGFDDSSNNGQQSKPANARFAESLEVFSLEQAYNKDKVILSFSSLLKCCDCENTSAPSFSPIWTTFRIFRFSGVLGRSRYFFLAKFVVHK